MYHKSIDPLFIKCTNCLRMCLIQKCNATIVYILYSLFLICIYSFLRKRNAHGMFADKRAEIPNKKKKICWKIVYMCLVWWDKVIKTKKKRKKIRNEINIRNILTKLQSERNITNMCEKSVHTAGICQVLSLSLTMTPSATTTVHCKYIPMSTKSNKIV